MCGRYVSASTPGEIAAYFDADVDERLVLPPSWNVAPTDDVYVVVEHDGARRVEARHWGLVPLWAKDPSIGSRMINARAEGIATKNAFKHALARRRCLVPADGFYEWQKLEGKAKQPFFVHRADGEPLALAGLWEEWRGPDRGDDVLRTVTIVTTAANETMAPVHDRMPVILPPATWDRWLDPHQRDTAAVEALLVPAPPSLLRLRPVGPQVGNVRNNGAGLLDRVDPLPGAVRPEPESGEDR